MEVIYWIIVFHTWQESWQIPSALNQKLEARGGRIFTLTWSKSPTAAAEGGNPLTAMESNGEGALDATAKSADEGDDSRGGAGAKTFEKFQSYGTRGVYIPSCCQWHRMEQIGGTETCNCKQLQHIGDSELV